MVTSNSGTISGSNAGSSQVFGVKGGSTSSVGNASGGTISGTNTGSGTAFGLFGSSSATVTSNAGSITGSSASGFGYGVYAAAVTVANAGTISGSSTDASGSGEAYGLRAMATTVTLSSIAGTISATAAGSGPAYGVWAGTDATVTSNTGTISAASNGASGAGVAYGVHGSNSATVTNNSAISGTTAGSGDAAGVFALNADATLTNSGSGSAVALATGSGAAYGVYSLSYTDSTVDLQLVNGPDPANTTRALSANRANLQNVMAQRTAALAGMMDYDCPAFDSYGICLSFQARYGAMESMNDGAGVLTAAYRLSPHVRLGGFIDQGLTRKAPADLRLNPQQPSFGLFLGFNQRTDGLGLQGRISAALNQADVGVTRDASLASTEPGSGKARLGGSAAAIELGYGVAWAGSLTAAPYVGFRHTQVARAAYREAAAAGTVDNPIAYGAFQQRLGAASAGLRLNGMMGERTGYQLGAGLDYYAYGATGVYAGTSDIYGLEAFALPGAGPARRMSPEASAGLFHQLGRMQRLTINFSMRGQAFSNRAALSALAGYQAAF